MRQVLFFVIFIPMATALVVVHPVQSGRGGDYDARRAAEVAHRKALEISGICAIILGTSRGNNFCTGIFIHERDGLGFVLTSARRIQRNSRSIWLSFRPSIQENQRIPVLRVYLHPQFDASNARSAYDIAILEFEVSGLDQKITPISLSARDRYEPDGFVEGQIAGYGSFGTNRTNLLDLRQVHAGKTWVQFRASSGGVPLFVSRIPHITNRFDIPPAVNQHFDVMRPAYHNIMIEMPGVKMHPEQSMVVDGDSGGLWCLKV